MLKLKINGQKYEADADPKMPLLWFLRDHIDLTGTKYGCGIGQCGACSVLLDGKAVRACLIPVGSIGKQKITTIEGLAKKDKLHPVQQAWIDEDVPQCGYCQAGQVMTAVSLLKENPNPSDEEIKEKMDNNLCRCGTYQRVRKAIKVAASKL